jgi:hypothetical protein
MNKQNMLGGGGHFSRAETTQNLTLCHDTQLLPTTPPDVIFARVIL